MREGEALAPRAVLKQLRRSPSPPTSPTDTDEVQRGEPSKSKTQEKERRSWFSPRAVKRSQTTWKEPQVRTYLISA